MSKNGSVSSEGENATPENFNENKCPSHKHENEKKAKPEVT